MTCWNTKADSGWQNLFWKSIPSKKFTCYLRSEEIGKRFFNFCNKTRIIFSASASLEIPDQQKQKDEEAEIYEYE